MSLDVNPASTEIADYMYKRRPKWMIDAIARKPTSKVPRFYDYNGDTGDYTLDRSPNPSPISAKQLVAMQAERLGRPLNILDIGAGVGSFVLSCINQGHYAIGLSLHNYRRSRIFRNEARKLPKSAYVVGDVQKMAEIAKINRANDLIVSSWTFLHLGDPLGALEQIADKVACGGILAIDRVPECGFIYDDRDPKIRNNSPRSRQQAAVALSASGFIPITPDLEALPWPHTLPYTVLLQRTDASVPVRFPIEYQSRQNQTV